MMVLDKEDGITLFSMGRLEEMMVSFSFLFFWQFGSLAAASEIVAL